MARAWGYWTRGKLDILRDYLDAFTTASKSANERVYLDLFAGQAENVERVTGKQLQASPRIALSTDNPPFTRLRFFEIANADDLRVRLSNDFPNRDFRVIKGDCNDTMNSVLRELHPLRWAPTFAFIDPNGPDTHWSTLQALAAFRPSRYTKVELWMLFPEPMFVRLLRTDGHEVRPEDMERITAMFGTGRWGRIYEARVQNDLTPREARTEYVNLMRWRLEKELGYKRTHALEVHNEKGNPIYHMIFATDHVAGDRIMSSLYSKALEEFPKMREWAIEQRTGKQKLFDDTEYRTKPDSYRYEPPTSPYGSR